jgi:hypothetical protein
MQHTRGRQLPCDLYAYAHQLTVLDLSQNDWLLNFLPNMAASFRALRMFSLAQCRRLPRSLQRQWDVHDAFALRLFGWTLWSSYHPGLLAVDAYTERCEQQRRVGVILLSRRLFGGVPKDLRRAIVCLMMQQFREQL